MIERILAIIASVALIGVSGMLLYDKLWKEDVAVIVGLDKTEDPFVKLPKILPSNSSLRSVREFDKFQNEYLIIVSTREGKKDLVKKILSSKGVKNARHLE